MFRQLKNRQTLARNESSRTDTRRDNPIELLEPRTLLSGAESASAQLQLLSTTGTAAAPIYNYNITLANKGTTTLGTFWFAWVPGADFLPSAPLSEKSPAGWTANVTGSGNSFDGSAIMWVAQSNAADVAAGKSLSGFQFSSPDSPAKLAGRSPDYPATPAMTSVVFSGAPFSDAGFQFVVSPAVVATQPPALNAAVTADIAATNADFLKFKSGFVFGSNTLVADAATVKTDDAKQAKTVAPLITKLGSDVKSIQTALQTDTLADSSLVTSEETAIRAQEEKVIQDKANASQEAADKARLKMERIKLQADLLAQLNARITARQADTNTLAADANKLITAIGSGSHATAALQAAVTKFINDNSATGKTLLADLSKLGGDRTKMTADLTAEQSS